MTRSILVLATSATGPLAGAPTGCWAEEIAAPFYEWRSAGFEVKIASVAGGEVPWDEASMKGTSAAEGFLRDEKNLWRATPSAKEVLAGGIESYDALYLPGGHGAMLDLAESEDVKALVEAFWTSGRVVAAVCHGPAGLVRAVAAEGAPLVKGRRVTAFTNAEEEAVGKDEAVPFMLETRLVELGALFEIRGEWEPHVVVDGQLITGQNPQSSFALAQAVAGALAPHAQVRRGEDIIEKISQNYNQPSNQHSPLASNPCRSCTRARARATSARTASSTRPRAGATWPPRARART
jgi:putative intracellular protease/amidase